MIEHIIKDIKELDDKELFEAMNNEQDPLKKSLLKEIFTYKGRVRQREIINKEEFIR